MSETKEAIRAWVGSNSQNVPSFTEVHTSAQLASAEARQAAGTARKKVSEVGSLAMAVVIGTAFWLSDVREDGTPSPISRVEAGVQSALDQCKRFGGMVSSFFTELDQATRSLENYVPPMMPVEHDITNLPKV